MFIYNTLPHSDFYENGINLRKVTSSGGIYLRGGGYTVFPEPQKSRNFSSKLRQFFYYFLKIDDICELLQKTACLQLFANGFGKPSKLGPIESAKCPPLDISIYNWHNSKQWIFFLFHTAVMSVLCFFKRRKVDLPFYLF